MKNFIKITLALMLSLAAVLCLVSCNDQEKLDEGLWENATYREDTTVGDGAIEVVIEVEMDGKSIAITVKTDKATLGEALFAEKIINDASFFDTLNGVKADWNDDKAYWGFFKGEEYMMVGVNETAIVGGEHYRFVYTKG